MSEGEREKRGVKKEKKRKKRKKKFAKKRLSVFIS